MIQLIVWLVFGFIAGSVAEWLWPPAKPRPKIQTIGIGVVGSVVGGLAGSILSGSQYAPAGLVMSVIGSLACMFLWKKYGEVAR